MASIYVIRHGQASFGAANYDKLSELGCRQAEVLGHYLRECNIHFDAVYSGDLQRQQKALEENRAALERMRQKAELYVERAAKPGRDTTSKDALAWSARELNVSDNDVEVALLREKKRRVES